MSAVPGYSTQKRPEMVEFVPERRKRVLDIGCAQGDFLMALPGVEETWGIEPSPAAEVARGRLHRVFQSTFNAAEPELPLNYFDVVICNDVIEHMPDHDDFLSRIGRYISPGGVIVGSIPNVRFYNNMFQMMLEKDWNYMDSGILDRTHTRFFTEKSLKKTLLRHDLKLLRFQGLTTNIDVGRSRRARAYYWMSRALILGTFGYYSDIQYLQFAFQASPVALDSVKPQRVDVHADV